MPDHRHTAIALAAALWFAVGVPLFAAADPVEVEKATRTILCDCGCHPQSTHECACGRAAEMRGEIAALVEGGMTGDEVVAKYVAEFGEKIRIAPTATGFNLVAWVGPFIGLVLAGTMVLFTLRRWSQTHRALATTATATEVPAADDAYVKRLQAKLKEFE